MSWEKTVEPATTRLEVAGKFTDGLKLDGPSAARLAYVMETMARQLDNYETLDACRHYTGLVKREAMWCALAVAAFVTATVMFQ